MIMKTTRNRLFACIACVCTVAIGASIVEANPPYNDAPYRQASDGEWVVPTLDHLGPAGPPFPNKELMAYIPAPTTGNFGALSTKVEIEGAIEAVPGRQIDGMGFNDGSSTRFSRLKITPESKLPRDDGDKGYTISGWFKLPARVDGVNPIVMIDGGNGLTKECAIAVPFSRTADFECPLGTEIAATDAFYGVSLSGSTCQTRSRDIVCDANALTKARGKCDGVRECFYPPADDFLDTTVCDRSGYGKGQMRLLVEYECRISVEKKCHNTGEGPTTLSCPAGMVIQKIESTNYGNTTNTTSCGAAIFTDTTCLDAPLDKVKARCEGKQSCDFTFGNTEFGDPCSGRAKRFATSYTCTPPNIAQLPKPASRMLYVEERIDNRLRLEVGTDEPLVGITDVTDGQWHHYAIVFKPGDGPNVTDGYVTLFVDGEIEARKRGLAVASELETLHVGAVPFGQRFLAGQANANATLLGSLSHQDEIFVYDRPLSEPELRSIVRKPETGLLRMWPPVERDLLGLSTPADVDIKLDTSTTYVSDYKGIEKYDSDTRQDNEIHKLESFTVAGWFNLQRTDSYGPNFLLRDGTGGGLYFLSGAQHSYTGNPYIVAKFTNAYAQNQEQVVQVIPHEVRRKKWSFIAVTRDAENKRLSLYIDGHKVSNDIPTSLTQTFSEATLKFTNYRSQDHIAWIGLYDRALTQTELMTARSAGPVVWLDNDIDQRQFYQNGSQVTEYYPRDWADFHIPVPYNKRNNLVSFDYSGPKRNAALDGLRFNNVKDLERPHGVKVQAKGPLSQKAFTFFARVANGFPTDKSHVTLLRRGKAGAKPWSKTDFASIFKCPNNSSQCKLYVQAPNKNGVLRTWRVSFVARGSHSDIAIAYDGERPYIAIDGDFANASDVTLLETSQSPLYHDGEPAPGDSTEFHVGMHEGIWMDQSSSARREAVFDDIRFYARILSPIELEALGRRTCGELACSEDGRECSESSNGDTLAICTGCQDGHIDTLTNAEQGGICTKNADVFQRCLSSDECRGNLICLQRPFAKPEDGGQDFFCAVPNAAASTYQQSDFLACQSICGKLNRKCGQAYQSTRTVEGASAGGFTCTECLPYHTAPQEGDLTSTPCVKTPTKDAFGVVTDSNPDQCKSGKLQTLTEDTFNVYASPTAIWNDAYFHANIWNRFKNQGGTFLVYYKPENGVGSITRCAPTRQECEDRNRIFDPSTGTCTLQCRNNYRSVWSMLSPEACTKVWSSVLNPGKYAPNHPSGPWWDYKVYQLLFGRYPTREQLKYAFLDYSTIAFQPSDYFKLEQAGVGPNLIQYALNKDLADTYYADNPSHEDWLALGRCINPNSVYYDSNHNFQTCVAKKNPNGTSCPPPGEPTTGDGHEFCVSGYCARDTKICLKGTDNLEETNAENDQSSNSGKENISFGVDYINETSVQAYKGAADGSGDRRVYKASAKNGIVAFFFGNRFDVFTINPKIASESDGNAKVESTYRVFGIPLPFSTDPLATCSAGKWEDGEWKKPEDEGDDKCDFKLTKVPVPSAGAKWCPKSIADLSEKFIEKYTYTQQLSAGPVPIAIKAAPTIDVCIGATGGINKKGELSFGVKPSAGVGADVRGGIGVENPVVTIWAGVRAVVTIMELGFPVGLNLKVQERKKNNQPVPDLFEIVISADIKVETTILSGFVGVFAEIGVGPFTVEWDLKLFEWPGFVFSKELGKADLSKTLLDFRYTPPNQGTQGQ